MAPCPLVEREGYRPKYRSGPPDSEPVKQALPITDIQLPARAESTRPVFAQSIVWPWPIFFILLLFAIASFARLGTVIKIGADEDYELSKALLLARGFPFYTVIWNDQPLLHTAIVAALLKYVSPSVLYPRLLTLAFSASLLFSFFFMVRRISGLASAVVATFLLLASPGFIDLSTSCMVEIPALAPAIAAMAVLICWHPQKSKLAPALTGLLFGFAFQVKLINLILLPLVVLFLWLQNRGAAKASMPSNRSRFGFEVAWQFTQLLIPLLLAFVLINLALAGGGSYWLQLKQTWQSHFASPNSFEYGSPSDFPFDWMILARNWDQTIPALIGGLLCLQNFRSSPLLLIPFAWLVLEIVVFGTHKPWWSCYYVHNAVPIAWCGAIAVTACARRLRAQRQIPLIAVGCLFALPALVWMGARVYLQIDDIRRSPQTYNSLVLSEIETFKPYTQFLYTDEPVFSFHSGIPLPPRLAVASLKRFWAGDLTNQKLTDELGKASPGLILLLNDNRELPYKDLLQTQYSLVYEDGKHLLYARRDIVKQPQR